MQFKVGSYVGTGVNGLAITGVGFQADAILVKAMTSQAMVLRTKDMAADNSVSIREDQALATNMVRSMTADGFTVGTDQRVNTNGTTYHYYAFRDDGAGDFKVGTYVGNATNDRTISLGSGWDTPAYVMLKGNLPSTGAHRFAAQPSGEGSVFYSGGFTTWLKNFVADGFVLDNSAFSNNNGTTFYYLAFKASTSVSSGWYTGNGQITGYGGTWQPGFAMIKRRDGEAPVFRSAANSGTDSFFGIDGSPISTGITAFSVGGYTVNTHPAVNNSGSTYYDVRFKEGGGQASPTNVATSLITTSSFTMSWTPGSSASTTIIQISLSPTFATIGNSQTIAATETSVNWTGLTPNTTYYSRVAHAGANGQSDWVAVNATTLAGPTNHSLVGTTGIKTGNSANLSGGTVPGPTIQLVQTTDPVITDYGINAQHYITAAYGSTLVLAIATSSATANAITGVNDNKGNVWTKVSDAFGTKNLALWVATNVAAGQTVINMPSGSAYIARIARCQEWSGLATSDIIDRVITTEDADYLTTHPIGPTLATTQAQEAIIHVWAGGNDAQTFTAGTGYSNLKTALGTGYFLNLLMQSKVVSATGTQSANFTTGLVDKGIGILVTFKPGPVPTAPSTPVGLVVGAGNQTATPSWTGVAAAISYNVYRSATSNGTFTKVNSSPVTTTYFVDTGLTNGTTYYYKVSAVNNIGESTLSSPVGVVPVVPPPSATYDWHPGGTKPNKTTQELRLGARGLADAWITYTQRSTGMPNGLTGALRCCAPDQGFFNNPTNGTVSEGQGYSMYLKAVYSNPDLGTGVYDPLAKADFDKYAKYFKWYTCSHGLMHWDIKEDGTIADMHGATDGDFDAAMAWITMWRLHGTSTNYDYGAEAEAIVNAIQDWEFVPENHAVIAHRNLMTNGCGWGFEADNYMDDYWRAAWIRQFKAFCIQRGLTARAERWQRILDANYEYSLSYWNINYNGGGVPDRRKRDYSMITAPQYNVTYNSVREGLGPATDILWHPTEAPAIAYTFMNKMANRYKAVFTTGVGVKAPAYTLDLTSWNIGGDGSGGVTSGGYPNGAGYGMVGPMACVSSTNQTLATQLFDAMISSQEMNYFNQGVAAMACAVMSGAAQPLVQEVPTGGPVDLAGTTGISFSETANVTRRVGLAGTSAITTSEPASMLGRAVSLAGTTGISMSEVGTLTTAVSLGGTTGIKTDGVRSLAVAKSLVGSTGITTTATSTTVGVARPLAGTTGIKTEASANTGGLISLAGTTGIRTDGIQSLGVLKSLAGTTGIVTSEGATTIGVNYRLIGTTGISTTANADFTGYVSLAGTTGVKTGISRALLGSDTDRINLLTNPGFEGEFFPNGGISTYNNGNRGFDSTQAYSGTRSYKYTATAQPSSGGLIFFPHRDNALPAGTIVRTGRIKVKATAGKTLSFANRVSTNTGGYVLEQSTRVDVIATGDWQEIALLPYTTALADPFLPGLQLRILNANAGDEMFVDETIISTSEATYFDGNSSPNSYWLGTINNSPSVQVYSPVELEGTTGITTGSDGTLSRAVELSGSTSLSIKSEVAFAPNNVGGNYFATPHSALISSPKDLDIIAKVSMDNWFPVQEASVVSRWQSTGSRQYLMSILSTGRLQLALRTANSTYVSSSQLPVWEPGSTHWIRSTRNGTTGVHKQYVSDNGIDWTEIGSLTLGTLNMSNENAPLQLGAQTNDLKPFAGKIYSVNITGDNGTMVDLNFTDYSIANGQAPNVVTDRVGNVFTASGADWNWSSNNELTRTVGLFGSTSIKASLSGAVGNNISISGTTRVTLSETADLSRTVGLAGTTGIVTTEVAALSALRPLAGTTGITTSETGAIGVNYAIAGTTGLAMTTLASQSGIVSLSGTTGIRTNNSASVGLSVVLAGSTSINTNTVSNVNRNIGLAGTTGIDINVAGFTSVLRTLSGSTGITASNAATPYIDRGIGGDTAISTSANGSVGIRFQLVGSTQIMMAAYLVPRIIRGLAGTTGIDIDGTGTLTAGVLENVSVFFDRPTDRLSLDGPEVRLTVELKVQTQKRSSEV